MRNENEILAGNKEMDKNENTQDPVNLDIELTVEEIQRIMDGMDKRTFGSFTGLEWEGSVQNAPLKK